MMRNFKKFLAVVCSLTLVAGSSVTAFADGPSSTAGTGNILSYSLESVIVPTSIKIALNPQAYTITKKAATEEAAAEYDEFAYSESSDTEEKMEAEFKENKGYLFTRTGAGTDGDPYVYAAADAFDKDETYYQVTTPATTQAAAVTTTDQIVSFNYGIANFSTAAKDVNVSFAATGTVSNAAGKQAITFVDDIKKAQAYVESTNADGAKVDELKMYLAVVAAKEQPKLDSSTDFGITTVSGGKDITNVTANALADVSMTNATDNAGAVAFEAGTGTTIAKADIAFKLDKAVYQIRDYDTLDWDTTQADLAKMTEIKTLGAITGFTFIGAMNPNVDWTTANVTSLTFTPTYTVSKITDTEEAVTGGYKQIKTAAQAAAAADATATAAANTFKTTYADILAKTTETVTYEDLAAEKGITAALTAYAALSEAAQGKLTTEKNLLDSLKTAAEAKQETTEEAGVVFVEGAYWLGASTSAGFESAVTPTKVTLKCDNNAEIDVTSKATVVNDGGYWVSVTWDDAEALGLQDGHHYVMTAKIGTVTYTGSVDF